MISFQLALLNIFSAETKGKIRKQECAKEYITTYLNDASHDNKIDYNHLTFIYIAKPKTMHWYVFLLYRAYFVFSMYFHLDPNIINFNDGFLF